MADQTFQVMFRGQTAPGIPIETVKANLATLFKTDAAKIERLFSGRAVVLKKGLGQAEGQRYRALLAGAGALCELVPSPGEDPSPPPPAARKPSPAPQRPGNAADPSPKATGDAGAGGPPPKLMQRAAAMKEKVKAVRSGDLHQTLGALRDKVQDLDTEEAGEKVTALIKGVTSRLKGDLPRGGLAGLKQKKIAWGLGAAALAVILVLYALLGGGARPMPIEKRVFDKFAKQYFREVRQTDLSTVSTSVLIGRARDVIEDMGFDFDQTLLLWLFRKDLVERQGGLDIYNTILVEPVAVGVAAGLSGVDVYITPATKQVFQTVAAIPSGVDLAAIEMVKACPSEGDLLRHDDLLQVLETNAVAIETSPDLAIADAFFGLEQAGFVKIQRRWEKDEQFSDLEILDRDGMNAAEAKLRYLDEMQRQFHVE